MTKPIFDLKDYENSGRVCMHFATQEQHDAFCEYLDSMGRRWCSGERYTERSYYPDDGYGDSTVYFFKEGTYGRIEYAEAHNVLVLESDDFEWSSSAPYNYELDLTFDKLFGEA